MNDAYALEAEISSCVRADLVEKLTLLLAPFAPYMTQEIWELMGRSGPVFRQPWPEFDSELAKEEGAEVVLQINGKLRSKIIVSFGIPKPELERLALADDKIQAYVAGKQIVKIIVVPDKLVNIVIKG
jgi:leucyl-tRNA synthetase